MCEPGCHLEKWKVTARFPDIDYKWACLLWLRDEWPIYRYVAHSRAKKKCKPPCHIERVILGNMAFVIEENEYSLSELLVASRALTAYG